MHALRVLEFAEVLEGLARECHTPMGQAEALNLLPAWRPEVVRTRQAQTSEAYDLLGKASVSLEGARDLIQTARLAQKGGTLDAATLHGVGVTMRVMRITRGMLTPRQAEFPELWSIARLFVDHERLESRILESVDGDGEVRNEASPHLATLRDRKARAAQRIHQRIQQYVSGRTRELLSDAVFTMRDGRYVIPLKAENRGKIKGIVHDTSGSGQTLYLEPEDVVQLGNQLREAEAAEREEVRRILAALSDKVGQVGEELADGVEALGRLDLVLAKARLGTAMRGCSPQIIEGHYVRLTAARHPLIDPQEVVPLSMELGGEGPGMLDALLITGPNTGGKTVAIKCVGLCVAMAQSGMMPPAEEMKLGPFTQMWADIGDEQSLQQSLSTFSGHIKNISTALRQLQEGALVLLDEIGAGTDPEEGAALARALLLTFQARGARVMASTHYGELKIMAANAPGFLNAAMEFDSKTLRPTYRLMMGVPGSSHALKIAERYGIPTDVVDEARRGIAEEDLDIAKMIEKLELAQRLAQRAQSEADRMAAQLKKLEKDYEHKLQAAEEAKRSAKEKAAEDLQTALREIRLEAASVFEDLKAGADPRAVEKARQKLKDLQTVGEELRREMKPADRLPAQTLRPDQLTKGCTVKVQGFGMIGNVLEEPKAGKVLVMLGSMKVNADLRKVQLVSGPPTPDVHRSSSAHKLHLQRAMTVKTELNLRALRSEDAAEELDRFLDDAVLAGLATARVVHGKGEGILRKVVQEALRRHRGVKSHRLGDANEGGDGVTIVTLK